MTTQSPFNWQDIFQDVFSRQPEMAFLGSLSQQGGTQGMQDYFRRRTGEFQQRFQQHLSRQMLDADPNTFDPNKDLTRAEDFFGGLNFQEEFLKQSPTSRGFFSGQFAPKTRFLYR